MSKIKSNKRKEIQKDKKDSSLDQLIKKELSEIYSVYSTIGLSEDEFMKLKDLSRCECF